MCNDNRSRPELLEWLGRKMLVACLVLAVITLIAPALVGGAAGAGLVGLGVFLLKASWTA
jgi:hypothetical protein